MVSKHRLSRRKFAKSSLAMGSWFTWTLASGAPFGQQDAPKKDSANLNWYDPEQWGIEGRGFADTASFYHRLPAKAQGVVRDPVWNLSQQSAGMVVHFNTNATSIHVQYGLTSNRLAMPHMPATGVSGVDLYAKDAEGAWRWVAVSRPTNSQVDVRLAAGLITATPDQLRQFRLYLPLYNGVSSLRIGVPDRAQFETVAPRDEKPILFYGTSIMHGACASRSGMAIPAIVGRRLDRTTLNLGFSGNGRMEPEVGQLLSELDPCVFAIDCLPNMGAEQVAQRAVPLVKQLRSARPTTPVLLVEDRVFTNAWIRKGATDAHAKRRKALRDSFETLRAEGVNRLFYLEHERLLGDDGDACTDGSHPSDLGMVRYADAYEGVLKQILA